MMSEFAYTQADRSGIRALRAFVAVTVVALMLAPSGARAWEAPESAVALHNRSELRLETPHVKWARPYAGGTLRVLHFVDSRSHGMETFGREPFELMQRFDIEADVAFRYNYYRQHWFGCWVGERRILRLLTENTYDAFVFQYVTPGTGESRAWTDRRKAILRDAVAKGAGVVLAGIAPDDTFEGMTPIDPLPERLAGVPVEAAYTFGKGRIVRLPATPTIPYDAGWLTDYEVWNEGFGRALFWAAGRDPEMSLSLKAASDTFARDALPRDAVRLAHAGSPDGTRCEIALRRWDGERTAVFDGKLDPAGGDIPLPLPALRAGRYLVEAIARSARGTEAWATAAFEVKSEDTVTVALDWEGRADGWQHAWGEIGGRLSGRLEGRLSPGRRLRLRLLDRDGRILEQVDYPEGDKHTFAFPIEAWLPSLVRVEGVVMQGENEVTAAHEWFVVTRRRQGQFNFVLWGPIIGPVAHHAYAQLERMGVTAILTHLQPDLAAAAHGMAWVPMTGGHVGLHGGADRWVKMGPPETWGGWIANRQCRTTGVLSYNIGDEGPVTGAGVSPEGMAVYHRYLRDIYGTIEALNASWGSTYADFADIQLLKEGDSSERAAHDAGNYARWYDRQAFASYNFVMHVRDHRTALRKLDPHAKIGFEGSGWFARSADVDLVCRELDMWVPYVGHVDELIRSLAPREFIHSNWMGYNWEAGDHLSKYWRSIMLGADSVWWWMWSTLDPWRGFQAPDLRGYPAMEEMLDDTQIVRDGLGDLLINSEMLDDGVAMLYSKPSGYAATLPGSSSYNDPRATGDRCSYSWFHHNWYTLIHDMPLQFTYVTDRTLDRGEFDPARYRLLILPMAAALSETSAAAVRAFVEQGGTVIADVRPGVYNGHCKPLDKGLLDDLFGIEGPVRTAAIEADVRIEGVIGEREIKLTRARIQVDPSIRVTTGTALGKAGDAPVFIVNEVGRGRAILLNMSANQTLFNGRYPAHGLGSMPSSEELSGDLWKAFMPVFEAAGVFPAVSIAGQRRPDPPHLANVRIQRWRNGEMEIIGLFREAGPPAAALVNLHRQLGDNLFVYDLRNGTTLGEMEARDPADAWHKRQQHGHILTEIVPHRASFYAVLPGPAPAVRGVLSQTRVARGQRVHLDIALPEAGSALHAVKLRGAYPDGAAIASWEQVVLAGAAPVRVALPVAVNDPRGEYRITLTDVITPTTRRMLSVIVE